MCLLHHTINNSYPQLGLLVSLLNKSVQNNTLKLTNDFQKGKNVQAFS
jgi:hypothetical protein